MVDIDHWFYCFLYRGAGRGGLVHELGAQAWVYTICGLQDCGRNCGIGMGDEGARINFSEIAEMLKIAEIES
jgi:hypothetical protein